MNPDPTFVKKLREIDPHLRVVWTSGLERWVVWYLGEDGQDYRIHEVQNGDGSYRGLDDRVLVMLRRCDMRNKVDDPKYLVSQQLQRAEEEKERIRQTHRREMQYRSMQLLPKWKQAIANAADGIVYEQQVQVPVIYNTASWGWVQKQRTVQLLKKLGRPHLSGRVVDVSQVNPYLGENHASVQPNAGADCREV